MALPNLRGYWKYSDAVVRFRIKPVDRPSVALAFIPRTAEFVTQSTEPVLPPVEQPAGRQLELPIRESSEATYSNDVELEEHANSEELTPEVSDGPEFNY